MSFKPVPIWKEAPFLRIIIPFIAGIVVQVYLHPALLLGLGIFLIAALSLLLFSFRSISMQFHLHWFNGFMLNMLLLSGGIMLTRYHDITHHPQWIVNHYTGGNIVSVTLEEPPAEKEKSFRVIASVQSLSNEGSTLPVTGSVLIYFQKDSAMPKLDYGSQLLFSKTLLPVKNSGNPGAFDYQRYCAFQDIYQQVFLKPGEFILLPEQKINPVKKWLFHVRSVTVSDIRKYITSNREAGLAEALLIGYKDDLDKPLVQSYANTGVVHIIAISGMQLALIYGLLSLLFKPFARFRYSKWLKPISIIGVLWLFSLMSGGSPSVIRAAVMFTCIVVGESFSKRISIYNNLAASALLLLCYNPYWLWDTGFQLSYTAVLGIVMFSKPIYHWLHLQNKLLDLAWELVAVSLAAQVLTTPISIFYFHQFPNYFLLTNLVAVPLSSIVLFGELILLSFSFVPLIAKPVGAVLSWMIGLMNRCIEHIAQQPFSLWDNLHVNLWQVFFLYVVIAGLAAWLLHKNKMALQLSLSGLLFFVAARSFSFWQTSLEQQIVVYNVPQRQAIDFIGGGKYLFKGNLALPADAALQNTQLTANRISRHLSASDSIPSLSYGNSLFQFAGKKILIIDQPVAFIPPASKIEVDLVIISKNPGLSLLNLSNTFACSQWVFDSSNSRFRITKWMEECEQLRLSGYSVVDKGAFVMNMD